MLKKSFAKCRQRSLWLPQDLQAAETAQDLPITNYFRVYTNPDVIGVEAGGALKNIIGLAQDSQMPAFGVILGKRFVT